MRGTSLLTLLGLLGLLLLLGTQTNPPAAQAKKLTAKKVKLKTTITRSGVPKFTFKASSWQREYRINARKLARHDKVVQRRASVSARIRQEAEANEMYSQLGTDSNTKRPNILYIVTDDQPVASLSVMRKTMRWFRQQGRIYSHAYVATPICCPSRAEMMTGQYAHNNQVLSNRQALKFQEKMWMRDPFDKTQYREFETIAWTKSVQCDLYRNGYTNAIFGKYINGWQGGNPYNYRGNVPSCWDRQHSWMGYDRMHRGTEEDRTADVEQAHIRADDFVGNKAAEFIYTQKNASKPWFAYVSTHSPHLPLKPNPRYRNWQPPRHLIHKPTANQRGYELVGKPEYVKRAALNPRHQGRQVDKLALGQQRMLQATDDMVDLLRRALQRTGQLKNTLIIFTSDNGFTWGDHGLYSKFYPYLNSVQVPMMAIYPRKITPGTTDSRLVSNIDIAPTIYDVTGIKPMFHETDGYSMLGNYQRQWLLMESGNNAVTPYWAAMLTNNYHYIETGKRYPVNSVSNLMPQSSAEIEFHEFYRLRNGRGQEMVNWAYPNVELLANNQQMASKLRQAAWGGDKGAGSGCHGTVGSDSLNPCP